ncbi:hypothetical protein TNCV_2197901 [Trichonephila clavipes]|nr:hypothetical protein TNCV_2197901 [Trichonephila clavipes]
MRIILPSESAWSSPVILVHQERQYLALLCVDYRRLNRITKKGVYPLLRIDDTLNNLQKRDQNSSHSWIFRQDIDKLKILTKQIEKNYVHTSHRSGCIRIQNYAFRAVQRSATFERMMKGQSFTPPKMDNVHLLP